jgi:hypothetical protein
MPTPNTFDHHLEQNRATKRRKGLAPCAHEVGLVPDADLCLTFRISRSGLFNLRKRRILPPPLKIGAKNLNDLALNVAAIKRVRNPE